MKERLLMLWAGQLSLARAFWEYAILYGLLVNMLATIASLAMLTADAPAALALLIFLVPLPYNILVLVAVWRSAGRYQGAPIWADLARAAVVLWVAVAIAL
jgi:hypothetical protein